MSDALSDQPDGRTSVNILLLVCLCPINSPTEAVP